MYAVPCISQLAGIDPEPNLPLLCPYCCDDAIALVLTPLTRKPIFYRETGEYLYRCATCEEDSWL